MTVHQSQRLNSNSDWFAPSAAREALPDRRVHAVQLEPRFREPLLQIRDRRRIVVVEVRARGKQLDPLETVGPDLAEVLPAEPMVVVEMRRYPELTLGDHRTR